MKLLDDAFPGPFGNPNSSFVKDNYIRLAQLCYGELIAYVQQLARWVAAWWLLEVSVQLYN